MACPAEIADILCGIIRTGLLRIRNGMATDVALEADHLHNLPELVTDYKPELLDYYWTVERVCYIERSTAEDAQFFDSLWAALAPYVNARETETMNVNGNAEHS